MTSYHPTGDLGDKIFTLDIGVLIIHPPLKTSEVNFFYLIGKCTFEML